MCSCIWEWSKKDPKAKFFSWEKTMILSMEVISEGALRPIDRAAT
jgi:hypothetical protein